MLCARNHHLTLGLAVRGESAARGGGGRSLLAAATLVLTSCAAPAPSPKTEPMAESLQITLLTLNDIFDADSRATKPLADADLCAALYASEEAFGAVPTYLSSAIEVEVDAAPDWVRREEWDAIIPVTDLRCDEEDRSEFTTGWPRDDRLFLDYGAGLVRASRFGYDFAESSDGGSSFFFSEYHCRLHRIEDGFSLAGCISLTYTK